MCIIIILDRDATVRCIFVDDRRDGTAIWHVSQQTKLTDTERQRAAGGRKQRGNQAGEQILNGHPSSPQNVEYVWKPAHVVYLSLSVFLLFVFLEYYSLAVYNNI